jgi:hypothetical protein
MTPKEKAFELLESFTDYAQNYNCGRDEELHLVCKKECALIVVAEIYKLQLKIGAHLEEFKDKTNWYSYWEDVKDEIEKL